MQLKEDRSVRIIAIHNYSSIYVIHSSLNHMDVCSEEYYTFVFAVYYHSKDQMEKLQLAKLHCATASLRSFMHSHVVMIYSQY